MNNLLYIYICSIFMQVRKPFSESINQQERMLILTKLKSLASECDNCISITNQVAAKKDILKEITSNYKDKMQQIEDQLNKTRLHFNAQGNDEITTIKQADVTRNNNNLEQSSSIIQDRKGLYDSNKSYQKYGLFGYQQAIESQQIIFNKLDDINKIITRKRGLPVKQAVPFTSQLDNIHITATFNHSDSPTLKLSLSDLNDRLNQKLLANRQFSCKDTSFQQTASTFAGKAIDQPNNLLQLLAKQKQLKERQLKCIKNKMKLLSP